MTELTGKITPEQALAVVERLCARGGDIRDAVVAEATSLLTEFSLEDTADEVFDALDLIDIQDCRDLARLPAPDDGPTSVEEAAGDIIEEDLQPFFDQVERYHDLGMPVEEARYCQGVVLGIYRFGEESEAEIKDLVGDLPLDCADDLLNAWRRRNPDKAAIVQMEAFLTERCPKLAGRG